MDSSGMYSVLFLCILTAKVYWIAAQEPITTCGPTEKPTFLRVAHDGHAVLGLAEVVVPLQSLIGCAELCASNVDGINGVFNCAGFDYIADRSTCMLSSSFSPEVIAVFRMPTPVENSVERAFQSIVTDSVAQFPTVAAIDDYGFPPVKAVTTLGRSVPPIVDQNSIEPALPFFDVSLDNVIEEALGDTVTNSSNNDVEAIVLKKLKKGREKRQTSFEGNIGESGFYQKICLQALSAAYLSSEQPFSFEVSHRMVLLGSTEEVVKSDTLAQCLGACLQANELFDFVCKSAMYYYDTRDCLLNSDDSHGAQPLSDDTEGFNVDYFESHALPTKCGPGTIKQYVMLEGTDTVDDNGYLIQHVSLETCQHFCNHNRGEHGERFVCRGFAFKQSNQACFILTDRMQGFRLEPTTQKGYEIYEKTCLSAPNVCVKTPAFHRVPNHILIGYSQVVLENARSEQRCLTECSRAETVLQFSCESAMYFPETHECVLNYDTRLNGVAAKFFSNDTGGATVNYFDNLCLRRREQRAERMNQCDGSTQPTYVEYDQSELPEFNTETYTGLTLDECFKRCEASENFTCASFDYRTADNTCALSYQNFDTVPLIDVPDTKHYERRCVRGAQFICGEMTSMRAHRDQILPGADLLQVGGVSLDECIALCLQDPSSRCKSLNYHLTNSTCQMNNATAEENGRHVEPLSEVTYYENLCFNSKQAQRSVVVSRSFLGETASQVTSDDITLTTDCQYGNMRVILTATRPFTGYMFAKNRFGTCRRDLTNSANAEMLLNFPSRHFGPGGTARGYGIGEHPQPGVLGYGGSLPNDCGVIEIARNRYSAYLVVTMNSLGIPGLVTKEDRFYNVTCDYSDAQQSKVTATGAPITVGQTASHSAALYPHGMVNIPNPLRVTLQRGAASTDQQVRTVVLGEQLQLHFAYVQSFNRSAMGAFIRQCNASRAYGPPPQPEPLVMIDDGCPMPAVQRSIITGPVSETADGFTVPFTVFKFDGGPSVKISCLVDLCDGGCNPTTCSVNGQSQQSFGRRKRSVKKTTVSVDGTMPAADEKKRRRRTQSVIYTVVDRLNDQEVLYRKSFDSHGGVAKGTQKRLENLRKADYSEDYFRLMMSKRKHVCMKKFTFVALFLFLGAICFCQITVIVAYFVKRWLLATPMKKLN